MKNFNLKKQLKLELEMLSWQLTDINMFKLKVYNYKKGKIHLYRNFK